jgi:predicted nuclease of restriction endonuclease-like (RecB) superfamily
MNDITKLSEYRDWLRDLKQQIKKEQIKAAFTVNSQMITLYWDIGRQITEKQEKAKWGSGFIEQLSKDLRKEFPDMTGFSRANLFRIKKFYNYYSPIIQHPQFVAQPVRQIEDVIVPLPVRQLQIPEKNKI